MTKKEKGFEAYKGKVDKDISQTKEYLQRLSDQQDLILINARQKFDYDIEDKREQFAEELGKHFEDHIRTLYGISEKKSKADKRSFDALVKKHIGVTKEEIKRIVMGNATRNDIYQSLDREIKNNRSRFHQEHYYGVSHDYISIEDPETINYAIKYMGLDKHASFDEKAAAGNIEQLKRLFIQHGLEGIVQEQHVPIELKKAVKAKKKKKAA